MNKPNKNKGFTLIEIIVILVIISIMAVFGVASLNRFLAHGQQTARDQVARTVFMAAQTALTQKYNQDRNFSINDRSPVIVDVSAISPALTAEEQAKQGNLVYMRINPGEASGRLYDWLAPQINDKEVLNHAILIEYNKETGRVLSAFYTEKELGGSHVTLGYGDGGSYNVNHRSQSALEAGYVGYFGVDSTGEPIRLNPIDANSYSILLKDYTDFFGADPYGVLTAEIKLAADRDPSFVYTLTLMPTEGRNETLTFSDAPGVVVDFQLTDELMAYSDIERAMANPHTINGRQVVSYFDAVNETLVIVLDCVQSYGTYSPTQNLGIRTNYPGIQGGWLDASLTVSDGADTVVLYSDDDPNVQRVHALYGGMETQVGQSGGARTTYTVASVRHLNNIRYNTDSNAWFEQTANLYLRGYDRSRLNFTPLCNPNDPVDGSLGENSYGFTGTLRNAGYTHFIYDLWVDLSVESGLEVENAGLFDTIAAGGRVSGLRFATAVTENNGELIIPADGTTRTANVIGKKAAGCIAGINGGRIEYSTVLGQVQANYSQDHSAIAGGVAGGNLAGATITQCFAAVHVEGDQYAGGIVGSSMGSVSHCEAGTASWRSSTDASRLFLTGTPFFGARPSGQAMSYLRTHTANNTFRVVIDRDNGAAGGIVGAMQGNATVSDCVSACKVEAGNEIDGVGAHLGGMAGGIVGHVAVDNSSYTAVNYCYNAGAAYATDSAGGIVGRLSRGAVENCYNTGYVNREFETATVGDTTYYLPGITRNIDDTGAYASGGVVGYGATADIAVRNCYSAQYTGNRFGGIFGVMHRNAMTAQNIEHCSFLMNALNNTALHYVENNAGTRRLIADADGLARMYSSQYMRTAPSDGNLDSYAFTSGQETPGVGTFQYTYPTLNVADGKTSALHRTPYNPVITDFGTVRLAWAGSSREYITATFTLVPPKGRITFTVDRGDGTEYTITVPLETENFVDLHANAGQEMDIDGNVKDKAYMFKIKATATNNPEAPYQYTLYINYHNYTDIEADDDIERDFALLTAKLYNDYASSTEPVSTDWLSNYVIGTPRNQTGIGITTGWVLPIEIPASAGGNLRLTFDFTTSGGGGKVQTAELNLDRANNNYFGAVILGPRAYLDDPVGSDWGFPYYITGSGNSRVLHVVLWLQGNITGNTIKPNGLVGDSIPVDVSVSRNIDGGWRTVATKHFDKLGG